MPLFLLIALVALGVHLLCAVTFYFIAVWELHEDRAAVVRRDQAAYRTHTSGRKYDQPETSQGAHR